MRIFSAWFRWSLRASSGQWFVLLGLILCGWKTPVEAQSFSIGPPALSNGAINFSLTNSQTSFYYLLDIAPVLSSPFGPTNAFLGNGGVLNFAPELNPLGSAFYRVEELPLSSLNDILGDGIPDGFKLLHGLPVFGPSQANAVPLGSTNTWLGIYRRQTNLAALPLAFFPFPTTNVLVGTSNVSILVALTRPLTGWIYYQISGTAIPSATGVTGDYVPPTGSVFINNTTIGHIAINLNPEPDIEVNRTIVIALAAPPIANQTYTIATNICVSTVQIVQSSAGLYVGTLALTNGLFAGTQSVKMALRPGAGNSTVALLDVTGNALFPNTFSVPVQSSLNGFQLFSSTQVTNVVTNTPWGRTLTNYLSFGTTETNANGITFSTPVSISLAGLTTSGVSYSGAGTLTLTISQ
jgi:hypothetical protein